MKHLGCTLALILLAPVLASAQAKLSFEKAVQKIEARIEPAEAKPGQLVTFKLEFLLNEGWHTYGAIQADPEAKSSSTTIELPAPADLVFVETVQDPTTFKVKALPEIDIKEIRYFPGGATWEFKAIVSPAVTPGPKTTTLKKFRVIVCVNQNGQENCLPPKTLPISATFTVLDSPAVAIDPKYKMAFVAKTVMGHVVGNATAMTFQPKEVIEPEQQKPADANKQTGTRIKQDRDYDADLAAVKAMLPKLETSNVNFIAFILTAMFWGLVTLMTPCVFPMIPITVSFFLKQGEKKLHNPLGMASVYTLTIIIVLGVAALFFLKIFRELSINPWMNIALGLLFVVFALSLFGMFDIVLPSFLVRFTSAREGKSGYGGVIFMALSFSIVSFTCVAPFLGGFAGMVASGKFSNVQLAAGALAFAGTFAAPFFLLALFPTLLKKLPKSGGWMNTIKVVMGFLELAAALKFFRTAELRFTIPPVIFTYDFVLSMWIVMLFLTGFYLLNLYRLPHDEPQEHIGVPRMLFGMVSISVGLYLLPGLFTANGHEKQRPGGTIYAWVDAFLLPEPSAAELIGGELVWSGDLRGTIEEARANHQVVFIDFTGVTCTNCKLNEKSVFTRPEVKELFKQFRLVQMYTDDVPAEFYDFPTDLARRKKDALANLDFQREVFQDEKLPLYVLLRPEPGRGGAVSVIAVYDEGKINNVGAFVEFLKKGIAR